MSSENHDEELVGLSDKEIQSIWNFFGMENADSSVYKTIASGKNVYPGDVDFVTGPEMFKLILSMVTTTNYSFGVVTDVKTSG